MKDHSHTLSELKIVDQLDVDSLPRGAVHRIKVNLVTNALGEWTSIPVMVARGNKPGPVVAVTAAIHGNELNGIRIVQRLFRRCKVSELHGTLIGVPIVNGPGYRENQRAYIDGQDLNRIMPGREDGNCGEVYAHRLVKRVLTQAQILVDLHTASFGRVNSVYVRADLTNPITARMAMLQHAHIIVHNRGSDGTLRGAMCGHGIPAITVEVGDPQRFQQGVIKDGLVGVENLLVDLKMLSNHHFVNEEHPVVCRRSYWLYTDIGGLLEVPPHLREIVQKGDTIAQVTNVFGDVVREYVAPETGIVVGKSTNPVNRSGSRILHLGSIGAPEEARLSSPPLWEIIASPMPNTDHRDAAHD